MASFYLFTSSLCILFSFVVFTEAAPKGSLITHLPGFNGTFPSKHYSGYVYITFVIFFKCWVVHVLMGFCNLGGFQLCGHRR